MMLYVIFGVFALLSWFVGSRLKSKFAKYSEVPVPMSGADMAERMLREHGITNVRVQPTDGSLTDNYNPTNYTINLSSDVFYGRSVAAVAVAAHETGHAVQHATGYAALRLRTALIPIQNYSAKILNFIFIAMFVGALVLPQLIPWRLALEIIIASYAIITLTAFVTLGVEIDASRRAIAWLTESGIVAGETRSYAIDALKWAAYTYVVAALSYLATLVYYILRFTGSSRDE